MAVAVPGDEASAAIRLDGVQIAAELGVSMRRLIQLNAQGKLGVSNWSVEPTEPGGRAMRVRIEHGANFFEVTHERFDL